MSDRPTPSVKVGTYVTIGGEALKEFRGYAGEVMDLRGREALVRIPFADKPQKDAWFFVADLEVIP